MRNRIRLQTRTIWSLQKKDAVNRIGPAGTLIYKERPACRRVILKLLAEGWRPYLMDRNDKTPCLRRGDESLVLTAGLRVQMRKMLKEGIEFPASATIGVHPKP